MIIETIPMLKDNYGYLLHEPRSNVTAVIDPSEADPVLAKLEDRGWKLDFIFNTHHHPDHTGGNADLQSETGCEVYCSQYDQNRIAGASRGFTDGEIWKFGENEALIMAVPGHTLGHVALWFKSPGAVFSGDTLFSLGCGRLFEGTAAQMWASLCKLAALPGETQIYCGHEYTFAHTYFAHSIEPENLALAGKIKKVQQQHAKAEPTVPCQLKEEWATNPFLRPQSPEIRQRLNLEAASDAEVFAAIRKLKDDFKGGPK